MGRAAWAGATVWEAPGGAAYEVRGVAGDSRKELEEKSKSWSPPTECHKSSGRDFGAETSNTKWVTNINYIRIVEGWLYLAFVLDLFSRQVIGWSM